MPELELYEKKVLHDGELPVQMFHVFHDKPRELIDSHWHEHLELHYLEAGEADVSLNQNTYHVGPGDLFIANSNELHSGFCTKAPYRSCVVIFDLADISPELAGNNYLFASVIHADGEIRQLIGRIFSEFDRQPPAWKQQCRALVTELVVHLCRRHVVKSLPEKDSRKRKKELERLNTVLYYIEQHFDEPISNTMLAELICLSTDRFEHLFREGIGCSPLQYINDMRLKKAMHLLRSNEHSVTQVAEAVGFRDYNHFGRLFRKRYGLTPYQAKNGKDAEEHTIK